MKLKLLRTCSLGRGIHIPNLKKLAPAISTIPAAKVWGFLRWPVPGVSHLFSLSYFREISHLFLTSRLFSHLFLKCFPFLAYFPDYFSLLSCFPSYFSVTFPISQLFLISQLAFQWCLAATSYSTRRDYTLATSACMAVADCAALHRGQSALNEDELIQFYFKKGYTYQNIRSFLATKHGIELTDDQLRWRLKKLALKRRGEPGSSVFLRRSTSSSRG